MELAFFIGLLSALHCFGMCSGIVGSLVMSLHPDKRSNQIALLQYTLAYNSGRILSYSLAGVLMGLGGQVLITAIPEMGGTALRLLFLVTVILLGIYVGGWYPRLALIEKIGQPIWSRLQPIGIRYLPVKKVHHAFIFGIIWGWLPCGLVYYALLMAFSQNSVMNSALFMFAFGMGTFIPMLLAGLLAGRLATLQRSRRLKTINALLLILLGLAGLLMMIFPQVRHILPAHHDLMHFFPING